MLTRSNTSAGGLARGLRLLRQGSLVSLLSVSIVCAGLPRAVFAQEYQQPYDQQPYVQQPVGQESAAQAMADGERDAQADVNSTAWFAVGCLVGVLGVLIAYVVEPSPPPTRMLGKTPEYVASYTQAYRYAGKHAQGGKALTGCLVGTLVWTVIYVVALSAAASSNSTTY